MPPSVAWPPSSGLTTIVVTRKDAVLQIVSSRHIAAPADTVFEAILRVDEYPKWNTWVPNAQIISQGPSNETTADSNISGRMGKGVILNFAVIMDAQKPEKTTDTGLQVTDISTPDSQTQYVSKDILEDDESFTADLTKVYRVSWTTYGGFVARGLRSERFHEVIVTGQNECEVRTWEVMGGVLAYTVKWMFQSTLREKFELWVSDLKMWCEKQHLESGAPSKVIS